MSEAERIEFLKTKHAALEIELNAEKRKLKSDSVAIAEIKKRKLVVKDEIERLAHT